MKRSMMITGLAALLALGGVTAAYAAAGSTAAADGPGPRTPVAGFGYGRGMMGGGYGMMGGALCAFDDPAVASADFEAMIAGRQAYITALEAQLAKVTDPTVKERLTYEIELAKLMKGAMEARLAAAKNLPADQLAAQIALVQADVDYWSKATSTDTSIQQWIANHLAAAKSRLAWLQDQQAQQPKQ